MKEEGPQKTSPETERQSHRRARRGGGLSRTGQIIVSE